MAIVRFYEVYFPNVAPITSAEFVFELDCPSRVLPEIDRIEISQSLSSFVKLCCFLVLHELIHNKLYKKHGNPQSDTGDVFREEVKRLWEQGVYDGLL